MGSITKQAKNIQQTAGNKITQISKEANHTAETVTITSYKDNIQMAAPSGKVHQMAEQGIRHASDPPEDRIPYATAPKLKGKVIFCNGFHTSVGGVLNSMTNYVPGIDKPTFLSKHLLHTDAENTHHKKGSIDTLDKHADAIPVEMNKDVETNEEVTEQEKIVNAYIQTTKAFKEKHGIEYQDSDEVSVGSGSGADFASAYAQQVAKEIYQKKILTAKEALSHFKGYWNDKDNRNKGANIYTDFFNARECDEKGQEIEERDSYINGSHGMSSPAWERLCHAIAHGYYWASKNWGIKSKAEIDKAKENNPGAESYSPAYMPLTIVGHSEGNAPAVGACIGAMYYAHEMGWEEIPINIILLSIHQPVSFTGELYETYKKTKCDWFETNTNVPFGTLIKDMLHTKAHKEDHRMPFGMKLGKILDKDKNKQEDGIDEWAKKLIGDQGWNNIKTRAVQFSFANDRADTVTLQGDIPGIANACKKEKIDKILGFGINPNLGKNKLALNNINFYAKSQMNTRILIKFADNKKLGEAEKQYDDEGNEIRTETEIVYKKDTYEYWVKEFFGWRNIYIDAAEAYQQKNSTNWRDGIIQYNQQMMQIEEQQRTVEEEEMLYELGNFIPPTPRTPTFNNSPTVNEDLAEAWEVKDKYYKMIDAYAWVHHIELEAHFAPVAWINRPEIFNLPDGSDRDETNWPMAEGKTIWERITKTAEKNKDGLFYRVDYDEKKSDQTKSKVPKKLTEPEKRNIEKDYIDNPKNRSKCIPTNFVNNEEIKKWIDIAKKELQTKTT